MLTEKDLTENQQLLIDRLYGGNILAIAPKGFGKAVCTQTSAQELISDGYVSRVLIVAPLKVCQLVWATEWGKWGHLNEPAMALGTAEERITAIESGNSIVVINNENVPWLTKLYKKKWPFTGLVMDESNKWKSGGSSRVRSLRPLLKHFNWRVGLSASPLSESGVEIFSQMVLIDSTPLGRVQDIFRRKYFIPDFSGYNWQWQIGGQKRLALALRGYTYTAESSNYENSLPELIDHHHYIVMPNASMQVYRELARDMLVEVDNAEIEAPSAGVLSQKLCQVASGALYAENGKDIHRLHNGQIDWLKKFLKPHHRALISYYFKFELAALREAFPDMPVLTDDPARNVAAWNSREISLLVVHPANCAHGLNLQDGGSTLIMLSPVWSSDQYSQLVGRLLRRGQRDRVHRHLVIASETIQELMLEKLKNKSIAEASIMEHIRKAAK